MISFLAVTSLAAVVGSLLFLIFYATNSILQEYRQDRVPALLYHRFLPKDRVDSGEIADSDPTYVTYDTTLVNQMEYLHREGYTTISLDEFLAYQDGIKPLPPKPIIITCDDGFASNFLYALPVWKKFGMRATIFVTPDKESENFKKYAALDSPLTHEQMRELSGCGISIESHGMTHRYLTELDSEVVKWELEESKRVLEGIVGKPVQFLAVPSGAYNRTVRQLAKEAGYKAVFCMPKGSNNASTDRYALRRVVVGREFTLEDFRRILTPATACQLRFASFLQNLLLKTLGPYGLDALRDFLNRTRLGSLFAPGRLKFFLGGVTLVMCIVTIFAFIAIFH